MPFNDESRANLRAVVDKAMDTFRRVRGGCDHKAAITGHYAPGTRIMSHATCDRCGAVTWSTGEAETRENAAHYMLRLLDAQPQVSQALDECHALVTRLFAYFGIPANTDLTEAAALIEAEHERRVEAAAGPNVGPLVITRHPEAAHEP